MKPKDFRPGRLMPAERNQQSARAQIIVLVLACLVLGFGAGAFWFHHSLGKSGELPLEEGSSGLSESTMAVLEHLNSPIKIRFYSLLDPTNTPAGLRAFATRVDKLLSEYQQSSDGKIELVRLDSLSESNVTEAWTDGIRPFKAGTSDNCYLGLAVAGREQHEAMSQLKPEWEPALQYDLSRIIERVANPKTAAQRSVPPSQADQTAIAEVKRSLPNLDSMSLEDAKRQLRQSALDKSRGVASEMEQKIKAAKQRLIEAQNSGSETEQKAAKEQLQQLQKQQLEMLQQILTDLQDQITALDRLEGSTSE